MNDRWGYDCRGKNGGKKFGYAGNGITENIILCFRCSFQANNIQIKRTRKLAYVSLPLYLKNLLYFLNLTNLGFWTPSDDWNPGHLVDHKWEDSYTISTTYGFNRHENLDQFQTPQELIQAFVSVVR